MIESPVPAYSSEGMPKLPKGKKEKRTVQKYTKYAVELAEQMSKEDWQKIKHFGKIEMALYIQGVYQQGFKAGVESVKPKVTKTPVEKPADDPAPAPDPGGEPDEVHDLADRIGKFHLDRGRQNLEAAHDALQKVAETSELAAAYNEDRLLILPVKVGGVLYAPWSDPEEGVDGIDEIPVEAVKIWTGEQDYDLEDVGRYVFTTRAAAEAELEKQKGGRGCGEG